MRTKLLILLMLVFANHTHSQEIDNPLTIDSLINIINSSYRNDSSRKDTGSMINPEKGSIGHYKRVKYLDRTTGTVKLELFLQEFNTGITFYDSYYYWDSKVIFVERIRFTKGEMDIPRSFFLWNNCLFEKVGKGFVACDESVKLIGSRILIKDKK